MLSCEFCEISKNTISYRIALVAASVLLNTGYSAEEYSEPSQKSKMKLFILVKNLSEFAVITMNFPREKSKHLLLLK